MVSKKQNCIWIGIGVKVQKDTSLYQECLQLNKVLCKEYGGVLCFSESEVPHLNLYDLGVPRDNLRIVVRKLQTLLQGQKSFNVKIKSLNYFPFGLFFLEVEKTPALLRLHTSIVESISTLKGECICEDYLQPQRNYNSEQANMLKLYGNPYVLGCFSPHITVGHIEDQSSNLNSIRRKPEMVSGMKELQIDNVHVVVEDEEDTGDKRVLQAFHFD